MHSHTDRTRSATAVASQRRLSSEVADSPQRATPLDFLITLTAGVKRGAPKTLVMADMPFLSYQADDAEGVRNAGRFMTEGMADLVKVEVDRTFVPLVARMSRAGIPVVAHIGSRPQLSKQ